MNRRLFGQTQASTDPPVDPSADARAIVLSGEARFTMLSESLIRLESSAAGRFEDRASLTVINRRLRVPPFTVERERGWLVLRTARLVVRYQEGSGRFDADNLRIELHSDGGTTTWRPGLPDSGNLRGTVRTLDGVDGPCTLEPGLLSRDGWALVDDSHRPLLNEGDGMPWPAARTEPQQIDWYFFGHGRDYPGALRDFTSIAGRIPLPPRYIFGSWWSRFWAYSDEELKQLVRELDEHNVPLDVLVIDMDWHLDGWTGYTWNPRYFPDPQAFLRWAHEQGLAVTLNLHPADGVGKHEARFADMARALHRDAASESRIALDVTDPAFVRAYFEVLHHPLQQQGVDFWWIDWQQGYHTRIGNLDPLFWLNHLHFADMQENPVPSAARKRPVIFSRWGGLGNHRSPIGFSGDTYSTWETLAFQPHFTATAANVGYAYWSHDIGGHFHGPVEPEMYVRWLQWGALSPVLRTHSTKNPDAERRIWKLPPRFFEAARQAFHLRYALLPYIYTAARQCFDDSIAPCRPLYYHWPDRDEAYAHPEAYMLGDHLFIAPVTKPGAGDECVAEISTWLPPGSWVNWFTGEALRGPRQITIHAAIDRVPIFIRAGSVIPLAPPALRSSRALNPLTLRVTAGDSATSRLYEDDGVTTDYLDGQFTWTTFTVEQEPSALLLEIGAAQGAFSTMLDRRSLAIHIAPLASVSRVLIDGIGIEPLADPRSGIHWSFDGTRRELIIHVAEHATSRALRLAAEF
jgi:alpha-glucosidase